MKEDWWWEGLSRFFEAAIYEGPLNEFFTEGEDFLSTLSIHTLSLSVCSYRKRHNLLWHYEMNSNIKIGLASDSD